MRYMRPFQEHWLAGFLYSVWVCQTIRNSERYQLNKCLFCMYAVLLWIMQNVAKCYHWLSLKPVSCYTGWTEEKSETKTGLRANLLFPKEALNKTKPIPPTGTNSQSNYLPRRIPPDGFRQRAVMQGLRFPFQCWSKYIQIIIDMLRLVRTIHLLEELLHHPLRV